MRHEQAANRYREIAITTADRAQGLTMLYEAAIRNVWTAQAAAARGDVAARGVAVGKAHDILAELLVTLDHQVGGALAGNLARLYHFTIAELARANVESSAERLRAVAGILETLLDGWRGAAALRAARA